MKLPLQHKTTEPGIGAILYFYYDTNVFNILWEVRFVILKFLTR
jgi:hypothetical protein